MTANLTDICIELPLPMDITATLLNVIGLTYPGAVIKAADGPGHRDNGLVLAIPDKDRHRSAKKAQAYAKVKAHLEAEADTTVTALGPGGLSMGLPEYMSRLLVAMARAQFDQFPDAPHYLESSVYDRDNHAQYVVICARSQGQTPHALRKQAEAERDALVEEVARLRDRLAAAEGGVRQ